MKTASLRGRHDRSNPPHNCKDLDCFTSFEMTGTLLNPFKPLLIVVLLAGLLLSCGKETSTTKADQPKGSLFIIGGGSRDSALMVQLVKESGWEPGDWIAICPMSSRWDSAYISMNNEFKMYTQSNINCIRVDSNTVKNPATLDSLRKSKIIYLNGGDQSIFMMHIAGTDFKKMINEAYENGATIAGTSAGAALMSENMLTGEQKKQKEYASAIPVLWQNNIEIKEGLGFLDSVIVDQHFIVRSRHNRLMSAVLDNPKFMGIGIDESTAIIVRGDLATVAGESVVMVYSNPKGITKRGADVMSAKALELNMYLAGDKFRVKQ
jgi:cyanophycinase